MDLAYVCVFSAGELARVTDKEGGWIYTYWVS